MRILQSDDLRDYVERNGTPGGQVATDLLAETAEATGAAAAMSVSEHQARFLEMLTRAMGVRLAVEIGTFTGRSSLAIASGLEPGAQLVCCDVSEEWTAIARRAWERAGVDDRIELRIGPASETLSKLAAELDDAGARLDLAFIDADKTGYLDYYEQLVPMMRIGGIILVDNVLWSGRVLDDDDQTDDTVAIRRFNEHVLTDQRTQSSLLPIGDGLSMHQRLVG